MSMILLPHPSLWLGKVIEFKFLFEVIADSANLKFPTTYLVLTPVYCTYRIHFWKCQQEQFKEKSLKKAGLYSRALSK